MRFRAPPRAFLKKFWAEARRRHGLRTITARAAFSSDPCCPRGCELGPGRRLQLSVWEILKHLYTVASRGNFLPRGDFRHLRLKQLITPAPLSRPTLGCHLGDKPFAQMPCQTHLCVPKNVGNFIQIVRNFCKNVRKFWNAQVGLAGHLSERLVT